MRDELTNRAYRSFDYISRYTPFPFYYDSSDPSHRYLYGTTANLNNTTSYVLHEVKRGETYDSIALNYYNVPTLYWVICDYNRIEDPFIPPKTGTKLKIPTLSNIEFDV